MLETSKPHFGSISISHLRFVAHHLVFERLRFFYFSFLIPLILNLLDLLNFRSNRKSLESLHRMIIGFF